MLKTLLTSALVGLSSLLFCQIPQNGLVAYFPFNGNAKDCSLKKTNGTIHNATLTKDRFGKKYSAYYFSGSTSSYIDFNGINLKNNKYSYSLWANVEAINNGSLSFALAVGDGTGAQGQSINVANKYLGSYTGWQAGGYSTAAPHLSFYSDTLPKLNEWYHVVSVRDSNNVLLYINGKLIDSMGVSGSSYPAFGNLTKGYIGIRDDITSPFKGSIDDVCIYNRTLSKNEIFKLYTDSCVFKLKVLSNAPICFNDTLKLITNVLDTANAATYLWTGPDNFISSFKQPIIINPRRSAAGTYFLKLTDTCGCVYNDSVKVDLLYDHNLKIDSFNQACLGDSLKLEAIGTGYSNFIWSGPNQYYGYNQNSFLAKSDSLASGQYYVTFKNQACSYLDSLQVKIVKPLPLKLEFTDTICQNQSIKSYLTANGFSTPLWRDSSSLLVSKDTFIFDAGIGNNRLFVSALDTNMCWSSDSFLVEVIKNPNPQIVSDSIICLGDKIYLKALPNGINNYSWQGPSFTAIAKDTFISEITHLDSGWYYLIGQNWQCKGIDSIKINVKSVPILILNENLFICKGDSIQLKADSLPYWNYLWEGPNSFSSSQRFPIIRKFTNTNAGTYVVTASGKHCTSRDTAMLNLLESPKNEASSNSPVCYNGQIQLSIDTQHLISILWQGMINFNSNAFKDSINAVRKINEGHYLYTITDIHGCKSNDSIYIKVQDKINPIIIRDGNVLFTDSTMQSYRWLSCPSYSFNMEDTNHIFTMQKNGEYSVEVKSEECLDTSACLIVKNVGLKNINPNSTFVDIYPNPSDGVIHFNKTGVNKLQVINELGKKVYEINTSLTNDIFLPLKIPNGIYFLIWEHNGTKFQSKLVLLR